MLKKTALFLFGMSLFSFAQASIADTKTQKTGLLFGENSEMYTSRHERKVVVNSEKAELCFTDTRDCHRVLLGKTTPKGRFHMTLYATDLPGYGGDVIGFQWHDDFLFALHRVWTRKPAERRLERIASNRVSDRIMTNGCINVDDAVYERLKHYSVLEVL